MTDLTITRHGEARMSQRAIRKTYLDLLLDYGTDIGRNRIMLRKRDAAKIIRSLKEQIAHIERVTNKVLIVEDGQLVTAYHQTDPIRPSFRRTKGLRAHQ